MITSSCSAAGKLESQNVTNGAKTIEILDQCIDGLITMTDAVERFDKIESKHNRGSSEAVKLSTDLKNITALLKNDLKWYSDRKERLEDCIDSIYRGRNEIARLLGVDERNDHPEWDTSTAQQDPMPGGGSLQILEKDLPPIPSSEPLYDKDPEKYYFRDTVWGMTIADVMYYEGKPDNSFSSSIYLGYKTASIIYREKTVAGYNAEVNLQFDYNGELYKASYLFSTISAKRVDGKYILNDYSGEAFGILFRILEEKYGSPDERMEMNYVDNQKITELSEPGDGTGQIVKWKQSDTEIAMGMTDTDYGVGDVYRLSITYRDLIRAESPDGPTTPVSELTPKNEWDSSGL